MLQGDWLAQSVERVTLDLGVVSWRPEGGGLLKNETFKK